MGFFDWFSGKTRAEIDRINAETRAKLKKEGLCLQCAGGGIVARGSAFPDQCPVCNGTGRHQDNTD